METMSSQATTYLSPEEYLEIERKAESKSEYFNGEMFAMSGGTPPHAWITVNVAGELRQQVKGKPCRVASSDLRLRVSPTGLYTYPDVMVICGDLQLTDGRKDTVMNPSVIVEVLSESTQDYDRGRKFEHYRTLPSLSDYLMVAQDKPHVEHWMRQAENRGLLVEYHDLGQMIEIPSIGCLLPMAEIYDNIDWTATAS
jgi:Uma2 family endonuclease